MHPNQIGVARGSLQVWSDFAGGNVRVLHVQSDGEVPEVHFAASPKGGPEAMWFDFGIEPGPASPKRVRCVMHFLENLLGGRANKPLHPVVRTTQRGWERVEQVESTVQDDGQPLVSWTVPADQGPIEVALCYPYGDAELGELLTDTADAWRRDFIGVTLQGRLLPRLSNMRGEAAAPGKPGVYCLARQHAGETPGSWVLDGFLRQIADAGEAAPLVWAAPFIDRDGVCAGEYGKDSFPWDFNRAWGSTRFPAESWNERGTHPMRPEIRALQNDMLRWCKRCRPALVLDFHAPGIHEEGVFCFLRNLDASGEPDELHKPWINAVHAALDPRVRSERFTRSGRYPSRWETARAGDFVNEVLRIPHITLETSYACNGDLLFTRETYRDAGRSIAAAIADLAR